MATTTTKKAEEERIEIFIPRGNDKGDPNFFVSVNGVNYLLPRGKKSSVPKAVYDEIQRAWGAEEARYERMQEMQDAAQK